MPASTKRSSSPTAMDKTWPVYRYTVERSSRKGNLFYYYIPPGAGDPEGRLVSFVKSSSHKGLMKVKISVSKHKKDMPKEEDLADIFLMPEENRQKFIKTIENLRDALKRNKGPLIGYKRPQTVRYPQTCLLLQYADLLDPQTRDMHLQFLILLKDKEIITGGSYESAREWFEKSYNAAVGLDDKSTETPKHDKEKHRYRIVNSILEMGWGKRHYTPLGPTSGV
jgi:hypothetical protein